MTIKTNGCCGGVLGINRLPGSPKRLPSNKFMISTSCFNVWKRADQRFTSQLVTDLQASDADSMRPYHG